MLLLLAMAFTACKKNNADAAYEALPELPDDLWSQLDTTNMTSANYEVIVLPVRDSMTGVALAPCCGIKREQSLQVTMPYIKCGPLHDFIVADFDDMVAYSARGDHSTADTTSRSHSTWYKLPKSRSSRILNQWVCVTSQGPWNAVLTENRACVGYTPHYSLVVTPYGDIVLKQWTGGIANHPADIGLVSCRHLSTTQMPCGGPSTCDCRSSTCKAPDPCNCGIENDW